MTLEEFKKLIGKDVEKYSNQEIEAFYDMSVKLFDHMFEKWKKEKLSLSDLKE